MKQDGWDKWEVVYSFNEDDDSNQYVSESQYQTIINAINNNGTKVILDDGRVLAITPIKLIRRYKFYATPEEKAKMEKYIRQRDTFLRLPPEEQKEYATQTWGVDSKIYRSMYDPKPIS